MAAPKHGPSAPIASLVVRWTGRAIVALTLLAGVLAWAVERDVSTVPWQWLAFALAAGIAIGATADLIDARRAGGE